MSSERYASSHATVTSEEYRRARGRFATGVSIASVIDAQGAPHGLTVSSVTAVSMHPPLVLICLGHEVSAIHHFRSANHFAINILTAEQRALSDRFARKGHDRFDGLAWHAGKTGVPLLGGVLAAIECAVHRILPMGDHDIVVGEIVHAEMHEGEPLVYFRGGYRKLLEMAEGRAVRKD